MEYAMIALIITFCSVRSAMYFCTNGRILSMKGLLLFVFQTRVSKQRSSIVNHAVQTSRSSGHHGTRYCQLLELRMVACFYAAQSFTWTIYNDVMSHDYHTVI